MGLEHEVRVGVAVCTPIPFVRKPHGGLGRANITVEWHRHRMGLMIPTNIALTEVAVDGKEVGEARSMAVRTVLAADRIPEFIFFIDYDVLVPFDALAKLLFRARTFPDFDIFAGVYCTKTDMPEPLVYKGNGRGPYWDWAIGDLLFDMTSVHMGCTLIRTSLLSKVENTADNPLFLSQNTQRTAADGQLLINRGTEDIYACERLREEADAKIFVDTGVLCGHQNIETGKIYGMLHDSLPVMRAKWHAHHAGKDPAAMQGLKRALDVGCGEHKRQWDGYWTYTLDIRDNVDADYVQDLRKLTLPDDHFDLVTSSHCLEHIGRWDQETVWKELVRILKPGGRWEHIVPNVHWAAGHILDGNYDEHVANVLYGAQEAHGYDRIYNTHFFGYTPDVAVGLCKSVGLQDIEIKTYKDNPALGYNMIITAVKPPLEESNGQAEPVGTAEAPVCDGTACEEPADDSEPEAAELPVALPHDA